MTEINETDAQCCLDKGVAAVLHCAVVRMERHSALF